MRLMQRHLFILGLETTPGDLFFFFNNTCSIASYIDPFLGQFIFGSHTKSQMKRQSDGSQPRGDGTIPRCVTRPAVVSACSTPAPLRILCSCPRMSLRYCDPVISICILQHAARSSSRRPQRPPPPLPHRATVLNPYHPVLPPQQDCTGIRRDKLSAHPPTAIATSTNVHMNGKYVATILVGG